jgi:hypothetical protein
MPKPVTADEAPNPEVLGSLHKAQGWLPVFFAWLDTGKAVAVPPAPSFVRHSGVRRNPGIPASGSGFRIPSRTEIACPGLHPGRVAMPFDRIASAASNAGFPSGDNHSLDRV